ncbi:MAG: hypothetical protein EBV15_05280 [Bacteroidetes bacterium]|nr:hypothetical protein [Bacteroidota bacterium]
MFARFFLFALVCLLFPLLRAQDNCLFKNPLCFYNTDVLTYLQVLHKNQQYDKMLPFIYGPKTQKLTALQLQKNLENASFGYEMKRAGVKSLSKQAWSLTYQRTIMGTRETFRIDCALVKDTCRVYLDDKAWKLLFER